MIPLTIVAIVVVSASFGGLIVYLYLARMREDLREQRDFIDRWESLGLQPARHWAQVRREAYEPEPWTAESWRPTVAAMPFWTRLNWRLSQPSWDWLFGRSAPDVGRHRPERIAAPTVRAIASVPQKGEITQAIERIMDEHDKRLAAGYYSSATAHVLAAREVAR